MRAGGQERRGGRARARREAAPLRCARPASADGRPASAAPPAATRALRHQNTRGRIAAQPALLRSLVALHLPYAARVTAAIRVPHRSYRKRGRVGRRPCRRGAPAPPAGRVLRPSQPAVVGGDLWASNRKFYAVPDTDRAISGCAVACHAAYHLHFSYGSECAAKRWGCLVIW